MNVWLKRLNHIWISIDWNCTELTLMIIIEVDGFSIRGIVHIIVYVFFKLSCIGQIIVQRRLKITELIILVFCIWIHNVVAIPRVHYRIFMVGICRIKLRVYLMMVDWCIVWVRLVDRLIWLLYINWLWWYDLIFRSRAGIFFIVKTTLVEGYFKIFALSHLLQIFMIVSYRHNKTINKRFTIIVNL